MLNRRAALKAAIGGLAAAVWPWKTQAAQPVKIRFKNTFWTRVTNVGHTQVRRPVHWIPCGPWYEHGDERRRDLMCIETGERLLWKEPV